MIDMGDDREVSDKVQIHKEKQPKIVANLG